MYVSVIEDNCILKVRFIALNNSKYYITLINITQLIAKISLLSKFDLVDTY